MGIESRLQATVLFELLLGICHGSIGLKKKGVSFNLESYVQIDNNVKFIMYKSSKSLQSEK